MSEDMPREVEDAIVSLTGLSRPVVKALLDARGVRATLHRTLVITYALCVLVSRFFGVREHELDLVLRHIEPE